MTFYPEFKSEAPSREQVEAKVVQNLEMINLQQQTFLNELFQVLQDPLLKNYIDGCEARDSKEDSSADVDEIRGKGLFATRHFKPRDLICRLSFEGTVWTRSSIFALAKNYLEDFYEMLLDICYAIDPELAERDDNDSVILETFEDERLLFLLVILYAKYSRSNVPPKEPSGFYYSQWRAIQAYVSSLPKSLTTPVYTHVSSPDDGSDKVATWSRLLLQGTDLATALPLRIRGLDFEYKTWGKVFEKYLSCPDGQEHVTLVDYVLVNGLVLSRVLSRKTYFEEHPSEAAEHEDCKDDCFMVPVLDLCNHDFSPNAIWKLNLEKDCVELEACRPISCNEEICICYGFKPNSELFWNYGFAVPNNPFDKAALLNVSMHEDDEWMFHFKRTVTQHYLLSKRIDVLYKPDANSAMELLDDPSKSLLCIYALDKSLVEAIGFGDLMARFAESSANNLPFPYASVVSKLPKTIEEFVLMVYNKDKELDPLVLSKNVLALFHETASEALFHLQIDKPNWNKKNTLDSILENKKKYAGLVALLVYRKCRENILQKAVQLSKLEMK